MARNIVGGRVEVTAQEPVFFPESPAGGCCVSDDFSVCFSGRGEVVKAGASVGALVGYVSDGDSQGGEAGLVDKDSKDVGIDTREEVAYANIAT